MVKSHDGHGLPSISEASVGAVVESSQRAKTTVTKQRPSGWSESYGFSFLSEGLARRSA